MSQALCLPRLVRRAEHRKFCVTLLLLEPVTIRAARGRKAYVVDSIGDSERSIITRVFDGSGFRTGHVQTAHKAIRTVGLQGD